MNKPPIINLEIFSGSLSSFNESIDIDTEKSKLYSDIKLVVGLPDNLKPKLPIEYKRAIADYLKEIRKDIKSEVARRMPEANYFEDVLLVFTVPAEYSEEDKDIMRECIYNAKLIKSKSSEKLQFITESEAAAIYCMENELPNYNLLSIGRTFIIIDWW
ncbi:unnamed protein product [Rhizophagus irregularis]|nr:unnamed protein product [Rhizophagus irregularis]